MLRKLMIITIIGIMFVSCIALAEPVLVGYTTRYDIVFSNAYVEDRTAIITNITGETYNRSVVAVKEYFDNKTYSDMFELSITRYLQVLPPAKSAEFVPHFDESVPLPDDLKEVVREIAGKSNTYYEFVMNVAYFVRRSVKYERTYYPEEDILDYSKDLDERNEAYYKLVEDIWTNKKGVCRHYAVLTSAMLEYAGVKSKIVDGYVLKFNEDTYGKNGHTWILYYDPIAGWVPVDPTKMKPSTIRTYWNFIENNIALGITDPIYYDPYLPIYASEITINNTPSDYIWGDIQGFYYKYDYKVIKVDKFGFVHFTNEWIDYVPEDYVVMLPIGDKSYIHSDYEPKLFFMDNHPVATNITVYKKGQLLYIKLENIEKPLYLVDSNNNIITPLYKEGDYWVYDATKFKTENDRVILNCEFSTIEVPLKEFRENATENQVYNNTSHETNTPQKENNDQKIESTNTTVIVTEQPIEEEITGNELQPVSKNNTLQPIEVIVNTSTKNNTTTNITENHETNNSQEINDAPTNNTDNDADLNENSDENSNFDENSNENENENSTCGVASIVLITVLMRTILPGRYNKTKNNTC